MNEPFGARPFVRCMARAFDYLLVMAVLELCGMYPRHLHPLLKSMAAGVVWIPLEAFFLAKWGSSPGKWILRTTVDPFEGPRAQWWKAADRGFTVFTVGLGCLVPFVGWIAGMKCYWDLSSTGTTSWDRKKYRVFHGSISSGRYCLIIGLGFVALVLPAMWRVSR
jgi:hypothetical protein